MNCPERTAADDVSVLVPDEVQREHEIGTVGVGLGHHPADHVGHSRLRTGQVDGQPVRDPEHRHRSLPKREHGDLFLVDVNPGCRAERLERQDGTVDDDVNGVRGEVHEADVDHEWTVSVKGGHVQKVS